MADLTQGIVFLLDKLYNLKGEENILIRELVERITETNSAIEKAENDRKNNEDGKADSTGRLETFLEQKQKFETAFQEFNNDSFAALRNIGIDLNLGTMLETMIENSPTHCERLEAEISYYQGAIDEAIERREQLLKELTDLEEKKLKAESDREQLISLLEQSLSPNDIERDSLTAHYVKNILTTFQIFDDEELSKLTKWIMFPDEVLYQFDKEYEERQSKGIIGLVEEEPLLETPVNEVNTITEVENREDEEKTEEYPSQEEITSKDESPTTIIDLSDLNFTEEEKTADSKEEKIEQSKVFLETIGLDVERFEKENTKSITDIYELLSNVEERVIEENFETLRSINIDREIYTYRLNHMYLADTQLNKKLTLLRAKGISESKIKELISNTNSGLRESYETLEARITSIENLHHKLDDNNIFLLMKDVTIYEKNLETLAINGYELDEKEHTNHEVMLFENISIKENIEILKNYLLSIVKNNGKYVLPVFWKKPQELLRDIDDLIEADLENLIISNPESLGLNAEKIIQRVKYCEKNKKPIYDGDLDFCDYITNYREFDQKFGYGIELPELVDRYTVNKNLASIIGNEDYVEILVNTLDDYYNKTKDYKEIQITEEMSEELERLKRLIEESLNAKVTGKYTYKIGDICISKNKFERNLIILLNAIANSKQSIDGVENEIILTSALYNLRQDDKTLKEVVGNCLGFNVENTRGGITL